MSETINTQSLTLLVNTIQELSLARDIQTVMRIVRKVSRELTGADGATFILRDVLDDAEFCYYADEDAIEPLWKGKRFPIHSCISGWAMLRKQSVSIPDIYTDERIPMEAYKPTFVKSLLMVPIRTIDPVGAIGNYWADYYIPSEEEISLLQSLADITAVTMKNIQVHDELEMRVWERTAQLNVRNQEITDSITYARRVQEAILPPLSLIKRYLPESFVFYRPKAIVAGDFYWFEQKGPISFIAAADCTGHGVSGAMVSMVCSTALHRSINETGLTDPGKILDHTRELVQETFAKGESDIRDGMDISFCAINRTTREMRWSGANNSLWYFHANELHEIKSHRQPIGKSDNQQPFPTHTLQMEKGDVIYLLTDGFADQFGGPKGKKFKYKQLQQLLIDTQHRPLEEQKEVFEASFEEWRNGLEQVDDITIIGIRF